MTPIRDEVSILSVPSVTDLFTGFDPYSTYTGGPTVTTANPTLGPNVIANGDFSQWSMDNPTSWTVNGTETASIYVTQGNPGARIVTDGASIGLNQTALTAGKSYNLIINAKVGSALKLGSSSGGTDIASSFTGGMASFVFTAVSTTFSITRNGLDSTVYSVSIKEILAPASLVTSPSAIPAITGGRLATTLAEGAVLGPELVTNGGFETLGSGGADIFSNWVEYAGDGSISATTSNGEVYDGIRACKLVCGVSQDTLVYYPITSNAGSSYVISFWSRGDGVNPGVYYVYDQTNSSFLIPSSTTTGNSSTTFVKKEITITVPANCTSFRLYFRPNYGEGKTAIFDNVSIKEVIPVWYPTASDGSQLWTSQTIRTRRGPVTLYDDNYKGVLIEPARTNKCTCRKANPTDTTNVTKEGDAAAVLSAVDDTATLTTSGLIGICNTGKVYKLDNSAGVGLAYASISGTVGNTNNHVASIYARGGSGRIGLSQGSGSTNFSAATNYTVRSDSRTPASSTAVLLVTANAGQIVYFILPQLEEGAYATSPIAKASDGTDPLTSLTRPAGDLTRSTVGVLRGNDFGVWERVIPVFAQQGDVTMFATIVDGSNYFIVTYNGSFYLKKVVGGVNHQVNTLFSAVAGSPVEFQFFQSSLYGMGFRTKEDGQPWSSWDLKNDSNGKLDATIGSTYFIGRRNSVTHYAANYPFCAIIQHSDPKAELERLATRYP